MARSPKHVLVVEDDVAVQAQLRGWLKFEGYRATGAESASEAREALKSEDGPAVALVDLQCEEGFQLVQEIQGMREGTQPTVIVMTEPGKRQHAEGALKLGAAEYLEKPVSDAKLQVTIAAALRGPQPKRAVVKEERRGLVGRLLGK